jgi:large subunit ribosomal protein L24
MAARLRKNDEVEVITGRDKGKRGRILEIFPRQNRAVVQGVGIVKRHRRAGPHGQQAGIISKEAGIDLSNLALVDSETGKTTKVGFRILEDGRKVRIARATGRTIEASGI